MYLTPISLLPLILLLAIITALPQSGLANDGEMAAVGLANLQYPGLKAAPPPGIPFKGPSPGPPPIQRASPTSLSNLYQNPDGSIFLPSTKPPRSPAKEKESIEIDISSKGKGGEKIEIRKYNGTTYRNGTRHGGGRKNHSMGTATAISISAHTQPLEKGSGVDFAYPAQTGGPAHVRVPTPDHRPPGITGPK